MAEKKQIYYAHGKLLLTAEYLVLMGAKALALPLSLGQLMTVLPGNKQNLIIWEAHLQDKNWFYCEVHLPVFRIIQSTDSAKAETLIKIFKTIQKLNSVFSFENGFRIQTKLEFNNNWGLGSSSTLIYNLASWTNINPYTLNELIFNGSGFDIACAGMSAPILYRKNEQPIPVNLNFPFQNNLFFVYSGAKKNTRQEIKRFLKNNNEASDYINEIDDISENMAGSKTLDEFQYLIQKHEKIISKIINEAPIQKKYFSDFKGAIKSLGAWGGDFFLVASSMSEKETINYFRKKGLETIFSWEEIVLNKWGQ